VTLHTRSDSSPKCKVSSPPPSTGCPNNPRRLCCSVGMFPSVQKPSFRTFSHYKTIQFCFVNNLTTRTNTLLHFKPCVNKWQTELTKFDMRTGSWLQAIPHFLYPPYICSRALVQSLEKTQYTLDSMLIPEGRNKAMAF
jgi:hypothetical protein